MLYTTTIQGQQYAVSVEDQSTIKLDAVPYAIDWRQIAPLAAVSGGEAGAGGRYSLLVAGRSYEVFARMLPTLEDDSGSQRYEILLAGQRFEVQVENERAHTLASLTRGHAVSSSARIQAPMPGLVVNVLVAEGERVEAGQPVIVLEAMKMENDLTASIAGTVRTIKVRKGQAVDQGEVLVVIEKPES